jgi:hypothetical protein
MAVGYQILIIKENKIYSMFLTDLVNMKSKFIKLKLPTNVIPLSIVCSGSKAITLTNDGLYFINITRKNNEFRKMNQPPGDIQYISYGHNFCVITTKGVYYTDNITNNTFNNINYKPIMLNTKAYLIESIYRMYIIATEEGLYTLKDKQLNYVNIDDVNDILAIDDVTIITTTGIYELSLLDIYKSIKITPIDKILHLKSVKYDSWNGKLTIYKGDKLTGEHINNIVEVYFGGYTLIKTSDNIYYVSVANQPLIQLEI